MSGYDASVRAFAPLLLVVAACSPGLERSPRAPGSFDTPWEDATPSEHTLRGGFAVALDDELPGAGWFRSKGAGLEAVDLAQAAVTEVEGARWPVLRVRILGRESGGWTTLELDIALNHWAAGAVPLDGNDATGVIHTAAGATHYLLDGELRVTAAGTQRGERVQGSFEQIVLSEPL